jgi:hypothetical protein
LHLTVEGRESMVLGSGAEGSGLGFGVKEVQFAGGCQQALVCVRAYVCACLSVPVSVSTPQPLNPSTPQPLNPSTPQPLNPSTPQLTSSSVCAISGSLLRDPFLLRSCTFKYNPQPQTLTLNHAPALVFPLSANPHTDPTPNTIHPTPLLHQPPNPETLRSS